MEVSQCLQSSLHRPVLTRTDYRLQTVQAGKTAPVLAPVVKVKLLKVKIEIIECESEIIECESEIIECESQIIE